MSFRKTSKTGERDYDMTRLENVIEEVKAAHTGANRPWIFDENGNIREDVLVGDVIPLLEELKEYEIDITDEEIEEFINDEETKGDNTYNWGANISNDLQIHSQEYDDEITMVIAVHLRGDVRANYSDYFAVKMRGFYEFYELESMLQHKDITDTLVADINLMSEGYSVYDYEHDVDLGEFYEIQIKDALSEIAARQKELFPEED